MGGRFQVTRVWRVIKTIAMGLWALSGLVLVGSFLIFWFYGGFLAFTLIIIAVTGILYQAQDRLIYHPELPTHSRVFVPIPTMFGVQYENLHIRSGDGILLHMFYIRQSEEIARTAPTLIFFHGNAGNIGHRLQNVLGWYQTMKFNVLIPEYRGYGLSEGVPSEAGLYLDAQAAVDYLYSRSDVNHSEIIVFGRSLGGAIAIDLAARPEYADRIWCLILENTFTSIPEMARVFINYTFMNVIPSIFYKNKYVSILKVPMLRVPVLFISGLADTLVPPRMMNELYSRCGSEQKQIVHITYGMHNDTWTVAGYYQPILVFLQRADVIEKRPSINAINTRSWKNIYQI